MSIDLSCREWGEVALLRQEGEETVPRTETEIVTDVGDVLEREGEGKLIKINEKYCMKILD